MGKKPTTGREYVDAWAITVARGERQTHLSTIRGTLQEITWREYLGLELARLRKKGDFTARIAEGHGYLWLTRARPRLKQAKQGR